MEVKLKLVLKSTILTKISIYALYPLVFLNILSTEKASRLIVKTMKPMVIEHDSN